MQVLANINRPIVTEKSETKMVKRILERTVLRPMPAAIIAATGIFGGVASLFIGLVCVAIHSVATSDRAFDQVGTVLLIIAIPMILVGSIFLDEVEINK